MRRHLSELSLLALSAALASPARAQPVDPQPAASAQRAQTAVYDAAFFAPSAPQTALDIARLVPGFSLDLGDVASRGFAVAAGNVVINGARPSSKAETLTDTLRNIPASRVVRVEVGTGDLYGAEYSTKSQVLNVILSAEAGIDGNITGSVRRLYTGRVVPDLSGSALITRGASTISLSAGTSNVLNLEEGTDTLTDPDTGDLIEFRRKHNSYRDFNPYVSASWGVDKASNKAMHLNGRWQPGLFHLTQTNHVVPVGFPERDDDLLQDFPSPLWEIGGDISRPLAKGAIKLVGLVNRQQRNGWRERYRFRTEGGREVLGGFEQLQDAQRNETLLRLTWTRANLLGFNFETGVEGVLNTLDQNVQLFKFLEGGEPVQINLPVDSATVKEKRAEPFINFGRQLSKSIRIDGGLTYEYSSISVRGDTTADRSLRFWKPSLTLDWKAGKGWHGQLSAKRTVAQLDFYDFISTAELSTDRVNAGNPDLVPQQAWEFHGMVEHPLLGDGVAKLDFGYNLINDLQDRVLIFDDKGNGFDAPGNIGTGKQYFAKLTLDAPLGKIGLKGMRLKFDGQLQRTRVEDPIDGKMRNFSGDQFPDWDWTVEFRHDLKDISYGFTVNDRDRFTFFRTDEFDTNYNGGPYGTAYIEYRPRAGTVIKLDLDNAFSTSGNRNRLLFDPNRFQPESRINEFRERNRHLNFGLTLKQSFGGGGGSGGVAPAS
jgi:hypothetical protein